MAVSIPGMAEGGTKGAGVGCRQGPDGSRSQFSSPKGASHRVFLSPGQGSWPHTLFLKKFPGMCE